MAWQNRTPDKLASYLLWRKMPEPVKDGQSKGSQARWADKVGLEKAPYPRLPSRNKPTATPALSMSDYDSPRTVLTMSRPSTVRSSVAGSATPGISDWRWSSTPGISDRGAGGMYFFRECCSQVGLANSPDGCTSDGRLLSRERNNSAAYSGLKRSRRKTKATKKSGKASSRKRLSHSKESKAAQEAEAASAQEAALETSSVSTDITAVPMEPVPAQENVLTVEPGDEYETDLEDRFMSPPMWSQDATGKTRYFHACDILGVAVCSPFVRHADQEYLSLRHYGLKSKEVLAIALAFKDNTYVTHLDLSYNAMGYTGLLCLARCLGENLYLTTIELSFCFLGREPYGSQAVHILVRSAHSITQLNISHNYFRCSDYVWLAKLLEPPCNLTKLDLSENDLGGTGSAVFVNALATNETLNELKLDWNPLMTVGIRNIFKGMCKNWNVSHVSLRHTGMDDSLRQDITTMLKKNDFIDALDLRDNRLTPTAIEIIKLMVEKSQHRVKIEF